MTRAQVRRFPALVFPFTLRGIFLFGLSIGFLALGVLRDDMAGLFWGSSFLLTCLYALAGSHVTSLLISRRRKSPGFLEISLPTAVLSAGDGAEALLGAAMPRFFMPGFAARLLLPLVWHDRSIKIHAPLSAGTNSAAIRFTPEKRGHYRAEGGLLEVRDLLGITARSLVVPLEESVKVFPGHSLQKELPRTVDAGGDTVRYRRRRRRSEELLEVRKYFPGDDPRKINWKLLAHMNEMFLRVGEETPPPESRLLFILDPTANPLVPAALSADYLDDLVEAAASAAAVMLGRGMEVLFWWPGTKTCRQFDVESTSGLMALLSDVFWTDPGWSLELPARGGIHAYVFSTPGSPSLARIMALLEGRGVSASLFLQELDVPDAAPRLPRIGDLVLLRPRDGGRARRRVPARALAPFQDAMAEAKTRYPSGPVKGDA